MGRKPKNPEFAGGEQNMITDLIGEKIDRSKLAVCKLHPDCFSCVEGYCTALHAKHVGGVCVFYKNKEQGIEENRKTYKRLKDNGRYDLLDRYGSLLAAFGAFDLEMEHLDQMATEMEEFRQRDLQERQQEQGMESGGEQS